MPLESATYIPDLVVTNPANSDGLNQADDHMRLIKSAVKATFPNFTSAALSSTQAQLDAAVAAVVTRPNATVTPGFIMDFAGTAAPTGWLECDGSSQLRSAYPDLFAAIGTTWGSVDGTHFNLPPDRYRRGRTAAGAAVGTLQADQNKTHTHAVTGNTGTESVGHTHDMSHTTGASNQSLNHTHQVTVPGTVSGGGVFLAGGSTWPLNSATVTSGATDLTSHNHSFTGSTGAASASHTHAISLTSGNGSADGAEARPVTAVYLTCIKT